MKKQIHLLLAFSALVMTGVGQTLTWKKQTFDLKNVTASVVKLNGEEVLKVERDLQAFKFDVNNMSATVDEPTYVKLRDVDFQNGTIEVKVLSRIQSPSPFQAARGFIGVAYRIAAGDSAYESIYLRPKNGRADNQFQRNHSVQYYSYPRYKFDRLRKEAEGIYETYADIGLDEWITLRIEVSKRKAELHINGQKHPSFVVSPMKGSTERGAVALWVDIGTIGYFKDLKITQK